MINLQVLNPNQCFVFIVLESLLPVSVEVLHLLLADRHVLGHLRVLDVLAKLILECYNISLEKAHFFHQILVELVLVDFAALF